MAVSPVPPIQLPGMAISWTGRPLPATTALPPRLSTRLKAEPSLIPMGFVIHSDGSLKGRRDIFSEHAEYAQALRSTLGDLERKLGLVYGDARHPLFLKVSLLRPALEKEMVSIEPVGLGDPTLPGLIEHEADSRMAYNAYRKLITDYAELVMERAFGLQRKDKGRVRARMDHRLKKLMQEKGYHSEDELSAEDAAWLAGTYKAMYQVAYGESFPDDPWEQLEGIISACLTLPFRDPAVRDQLHLEVSLWVEPSSYLGEAGVD